MNDDDADQTWNDTTGSRLIVRARRLADLSQRGLAVRLGVSQSTIARIESGECEPTLRLLTAALELAGLHLEAVDASGARVDPAPVDVVRDNAGRRFPAHLDVGPPDVKTTEQLWSPRYDRLPSKGSYHLRPERDRIRSLATPRAKREGLAIGRPNASTQHPTNAQLEQRRRLMRGPQPWVDPPPRPEIECDCPLDCFEGACLESCPCQCEPQHERLDLHDLRHRSTG